MLWICRMPGRNKIARKARKLRIRRICRMPRKHGNAGSLRKSGIYKIVTKLSIARSAKKLR